MEFRQVLIWGVLIGLFVISLSGVGLQMAIDNQKINNSFFTSEQFNYISNQTNDSQSQLTAAQETAESQEQVQEGTNPTVSSGDLIIDSTPKSAQAFKSGSRANFLAAFRMIAALISLNPVILAAFTTILIITFFTLIWGFIKSGR